MAFAAQTVQAATYYVATTGNDTTNSGTLAAPFKTIARGSRALAAGDTLMIRGGTYVERMVHNVKGFVFRNGLSKSAMTRYWAYPGEQVVIKVPYPGVDFYDTNYLVYFNQNTQYVEIKGLIFDGTNVTGNVVIFGHNGDVVPQVHARYNRLVDNDIKYGQSGIANGGDNEIIGNKIHDMTGYGIYTRDDNGLIEGNIFHDIGGYAIHHFQQNHTVNNWIIRNNVIYNSGKNYCYKGTCGMKKTAVVISRGQNTRFYNNLIYDNHAGIQVGLSAVDHVIANNTVYGNDTYGIQIGDDYGSSKYARIVNNLVWGNKTAQIKDVGINTTFEANLTTDPQVVNAAAADFHLRTGSPAINAGVNLYSLGVTKDFEGKARPQTGAFEIGAYEFGSAPLPVAFNFSLSNGGNKSVTQGASVTNSLTATLVSGTAQAVSLSVAGLPSGVTGNFSPASCTPNCSSTLTLSASASAATGNATVTVTAAGGGISRTSAFTLTVNATTPPPPPSTGPVGWWKLDENTGTSAADSSGSGNNGTLVNGPTWTAGRLGAALAFDGINDNVTIPHSPSLALAGAFSMSAWVNPAISTTNFKSVMVKNYTHFFYASSKGYCGNGAVLVGFVGSAGTKTACDRNPLPVNAWTHLAATNDGSVLRLYRNGVMTSSAAVTGAPIASTGTLQLGASRVSGESFKGKLDEARVYNRALSAAEVLALFNAAAPSGTVTDLNGDGVTNISDIQISVNQAAGAAACTTGDVNKDGVCNVADVQLVTNKTLGK